MYTYNLIVDFYPLKWDRRLMRHVQYCLAFANRAWKQRCLKLKPEIGAFVAKSNSQLRSRERFHGILRNLNVAIMGLV